MKLLISGYGGGKIDSIGMYDVGAEGRDKKLLWSSNIENPSYLDYHDNMLFGLTEKGRGNNVCLFLEEEGGYRLADSRDLEGNGLCHITYLPNNRALVGSCYGSGDIFSIGVEDQAFGELHSMLRQGEEAKVTTRAHSAVFDPDEKRVYSANIALDRIYVYGMDQGALKEIDYFQLDEGEGPRHIALYPELNLIYIITEYSNRIIILKSEESGFKMIQSISTLPEDFEGKSFCSTLCFTKDRRFLYGANRGANTIGIFKVKEDGTLEKIGDSSCFGDWPRHMDLVGNDKFIAIANERSGEVVIAERDEETGLIGEEINRIEFGRPSFVVEKR
ncbi:MAG TPA: beta-propeller fold lactonase family protein [Clostridia bacterium]|nr:beta-propeller fold lactonase family protein [Clostridia bacterium]